MSSKSQPEAGPAGLVYVSFEPGIAYCDNIPVVPPELLEPVEDIIKKDSVTPKNYVHNMKVRPELYRWLTEAFGDKRLVAFYQVMQNNIGPHVDKRRKIAHNYILQTGGPCVATVICNETSPPGKYLGRVSEKERVVLEPYRWHSIDVTQVHTVEGIEECNYRVSLSVVLSKDFLSKQDGQYWYNEYIDDDRRPVSLFSRSFASFSGTGSIRSGYPPSSDSPSADYSETPPAGCNCVVS